MNDKKNNFKKSSFKSFLPLSMYHDFFKYSTKYLKTINNNKQFKEVFDVLKKYFNITLNTILNEANNNQNINGYSIFINYVFYFIFENESSQVIDEKQLEYIFELSKNEFKKLNINFIDINSEFVDEKKNEEEMINYIIELRELYYDDNIEYENIQASFNLVKSNLYSSFYQPIIDELNYLINKHEKTYIISAKEDLDKKIFSKINELLDLKEKYSINMASEDGIKIGPELISVYEKILNQMKDNTRSLVMGLTDLNDFLTPAGGLMKHSSYLIVASPGNMKSTLMTNMALWISKYNYDNAIKIYNLEPNEIPVILYYSIENSKEQDLLNLASCSAKKNIDQMNIEEILNELNKLSKGIEIIYKHPKENTLSVDDIKNDVNYYSKKNYRVVAVFSDYMKVMKPNDNSHKGDYRLEINEIARNISKFSATTGIIFVTCHHLNAEIIRDIQLNKKPNDLEVAKFTEYYFGESKSISQPFPFIYGLNIQVCQQDHKRYMTLKNMKSRSGFSKWANRHRELGFNPGMVNTIVIPFMDGAYFLEDDINKPTKVKSYIDFNHMLDEKSNLVNKTNQKIIDTISV